MSEKFIYAELSSHNEFKCPLSIYLMKKKYLAEAKIDTGAWSCLFPLKTLGLSEERCAELKKFFVYNNLISGVLHGVENMYHLSKEEISNMTNEEKMAFRGFVARADFEAFTLDGYFLDKGVFRVSCDTEGNILIGMDVLQHFDFHIGVSKLTGKSTFIGCLQSDINKEYLEAIYQHFGYLPEDTVRQICKTVGNQAYTEGLHQGYIAGSWKDYVGSRKKLRKLQRKRGY